LTYANEQKRQELCPYKLQRDIQLINTYEKKKIAFDVFSAKEIMQKL
jgi:hypothetical protein